MKQLTSKLRKLGLRTARVKMLSRKEDAREKSQLGGLVKKVGLECEAKSVVLGLLLEAKKRLAGSQGFELRERWRMIGDKVFNQSRVVKMEDSEIDAEIF